MARVAGTQKFTEQFELRSLRLQHLQISALLSAVLLKTGPVTLTKEEAEASHPKAKLHYDTMPDGGLTVHVTDSG